jgi:TRAP-type C4-dicarboxylate transport system permease small subunit
MLIAMWLYMIGAAMAAYDRSHLKTEILPLLIKDPQKLHLIEALATFIALVMAGYMTYWSSDLVYWGLKHRQETPIFGIPWVVAQSSLFLAAILISIYFLHQLVDNIRSIFNPQDFSAEEVK